MTKFSNFNAMWTGHGALSTIVQAKRERSGQANLSASVQTCPRHTQGAENTGKFQMLLSVLACPDMIGAAKGGAVVRGEYPPPKGGDIPGRTTPGQTCEGVRL